MGGRPSLRERIFGAPWFSGLACFLFAFALPFPIVLACLSRGPLRSWYPIAWAPAVASIALTVFVADDGARRAPRLGAFATGAFAYIGVAWLALAAILLGTATDADSVVGAVAFTLVFNAAPAAVCFALAMRAARAVRWSGLRLALAAAALGLLGGLPIGCSLANRDLAHQCEEALAAESREEFERGLRMFERNQLRLEPALLRAAVRREKDPERRRALDELAAACGIEPWYLVD